MKREAPGLAHLLLGTVLALNFFGLLAISTSSALKAFELFHAPEHYLVKQSLGLLLGLGIILVISYLPLKSLNHFAIPLSIIALLLLAFLYLPGFSHRAGGAGRWLRLFGLSFQPSELAKIAVIFILAKNLSLRAVRPQTIYATSLLLVLIFCALLLFQPDFGSCALILLCALSLFYLNGMPAFLLRWLMGFAGIAAISAIAFAPYRLKRLFIFLDPWAEFKNGGFQIIQSYLAFQNGSALGVGFGESKQKLFYLPEAHTDFIFSVIAEECGLLGCIVMLMLFFLLAQISFAVAKKQTNEYFRLLALGLSLLILLQACFNLAVVSGLLPTKGITLPFVSSGASSLITLYFAIAILFKLAIEIKTDDQPSPS